jgi:hypothetical protein
MRRSNHVKMIDHIGCKRRYTFNVTMFKNIIGFKEQKNIWVRDVKKYTSKYVKRGASVKQLAQNIRKMILYVMRKTDIIFNLGDNDRTAGCMYMYSNRWITDARKNLLPVDPLYYNLFISTTKKYRRLYRQYILFKYVTAKQYLLSRIPWDTIGVVLSFL